VRWPNAVEQQDGVGTRARRPACRGAPLLLKAGAQDAVGELRHGGAALRAVLVDLCRAGMQRLVERNRGEETRRRISVVREDRSKVMIHILQRFQLKEAPECSA